MRWEREKVCYEFCVYFLLQVPIILFVQGVHAVKNTI